MPCYNGKDHSWVKKNKWKQCPVCLGKGFYWETDWDAEPDRWGVRPKKKVDPCNHGPCNGGEVLDETFYKCSKCGETWGE